MRLYDFVDYFHTWNYEITVINKKHELLMTGTINHLLGERLMRTGADVKAAFDRIVKSFYVHNNDMIIIVE